MAQTTTSIAAGELKFVVRQPGRWVVTALPAAEPLEVTAEVLLTMLGGGDAAPPAESVPSAEELPPLDADAQVVPAWMFVGLMTAGGIVVEATSGGQGLLDEVDVRLLTAVESPTSAAGLAGLTKSEEHCRRRLRRLVVLGCLRVVPAG